MFLRLTLLLIFAVSQSTLVASAPANWLLGGTWVVRELPCPPQEMAKSITPKGLVFSSASLVIHAPPVRPAEAQARFDVRYDIDGQHIVAHLSQPQNSLRLDMPFDEVAEGLIRDNGGYFYRRCGSGTDGSPVS